MRTFATVTEDAVDRAEALRPLLAALAREVRERTARIAELRLLLCRLPEHARARAELEAECSEHRRALRAAHGELARLDCQLVGTEPVVFQVKVTPTTSVLLWVTDG
jgi:hypothetical protein